MLHARADYNRIQDPAKLIPEEEPVFLLRGQDELAAETVRFWARRAIATGNDAIGKMAMAHADLMQEWPKKQKPNLPKSDQPEGEVIRQIFIEQVLHPHIAVRLEALNAVTDFCQTKAKELGVQLPAADPWINPGVMLNRGTLTLQQGLTTVAFELFGQPVTYADISTGDQDIRDVLWEALARSQTPVVSEPAGLPRP